VLEAIGELAAAWADPTEQARFLQRHKALIGEARAGLLATLFRRFGGLRVRRST
jgi:hypothetical protein